MARAALWIAIVVGIGFVPACDNGCRPSQTVIDVTWLPRPQSAPMMIEVDVGGLMVMASCPTTGDQTLPGGGSYSCSADLLIMQLPTVDLSSTTTVTVTMTTDAGQVLAKDMVLDLGPTSIQNADEAPGACSRSATVMIM